MLLTVLLVLQPALAPLCAQETAQPFLAASSPSLVRVPQGLPELKGIILNRKDPFQIAFILGKDGTKQASEASGRRLAGYFLASLAIPEKDTWVNLSAYEKDRILPQALGSTPLGQDLLAEDYLLKQLTASLTNPDTGAGRAFWQKLYAAVQEHFGTTQIPIDLMNKVWIVPEKAVVFRQGNAVYVVEKKLKVLTEIDHLAMNKTQPTQVPTGGHVPNPTSSSEGIRYVSPSSLQSRQLASQTIKDIIIPLIEKEINTGEQFATLRQIYSAMILAAWYKKNLRQTILGHAYADREGVSGVASPDHEAKARTYAAYLKSLKKGAYNFIREEKNVDTNEILHRKYFSGGAVGVSEAIVTELPSLAMLTPQQQKAALPSLGDLAMMVKLAIPDRAMPAEIGSRFKDAKGSKALAGFKTFENQAEVFLDNKRLTVYIKNLYAVFNSVRVSSFLLDLLGKRGHLRTDQLNTVKQELEKIHAGLEYFSDPKNKPAMISDITESYFFNEAYFTAMQGLKAVFEQIYPDLHAFLNNLQAEPLDNSERIEKLRQVTQAASLPAKIQALENLGVDSSLVKKEFLGPLPLFQYSQWRHRLNPEGLPLSGISLASGADLTGFFLMSNATEGFLLDSTPVDIQKLEHFLSENEWAQLEKYDTRPPGEFNFKTDPIQLYRRHKFNNGYGTSTSDQMENIEQMIALELKMLDVERSLIRVDPVSEREVIITFPWAAKGERPKPRTVHLIQNNLLTEKPTTELLNRIQGKADFLLIKAAYELPYHYEKFIPDYASLIKAGGHVLADNFFQYSRSYSNARASGWHFGYEYDFAGYRDLIPVLKADPLTSKMNFQKIEFPDMDVLKDFYIPHAITISQKGKFTGQVTYGTHSPKDEVERLKAQLKAWQDAYPENVLPGYETSLYGGIGLEMWRVNPPQLNEPARPGKASAPGDTDMTANLVQGDQSSMTDRESLLKKLRNDVLDIFQAYNKTQYGFWYNFDPVIQKLAGVLMENHLQLIYKRISYMQQEKDSFPDKYYAGMEEALKTFTQNLAFLKDSKPGEDLREKARELLRSSRHPSLADDQAYYSVFENPTKFSILNKDLDQLNDFVASQAEKILSEIRSLRHNFALPKVMEPELAPYQGRIEEQKWRNISALASVWGKQKDDLSKSITGLPFRSGVFHFIIDRLGLFGELDQIRISDYLDRNTFDRLGADLLLAKTTLEEWADPNADNILKVRAIHTLKSIKSLPPAEKMDWNTKRDAARFILHGLLPQIRPALQDVKAALDKARFFETIDDLLEYLAKRDGIIGTVQLAQEPPEPLESGAASPAPGSAAMVTGNTAPIVLTGPDSTVKLIADPKKSVLLLPKSPPDRSKPRDFPLGTFKDRTGKTITIYALETIDNSFGFDKYVLHFAYLNRGDPLPRQTDLLDSELELTATDMDNYWEISDLYPFGVTTLDLIKRFGGTGASDLIMEYLIRTMALTGVDLENSGVTEFSALRLYFRQRLKRGLPWPNLIYFGDANNYDKYLKLTDVQLSGAFFDAANTGDLIVGDSQISNKLLRLKHVPGQPNHYKVLKSSLLKIRAGDTIQVSFPDSIVTKDGQMFGRIGNVENMIYVKGFDRAMDSKQPSAAMTSNILAEDLVDLLRKLESLEDFSSKESSARVLSKVAPADARFKLGHAFTQPIIGTTMISSPSWFLRRAADKDFSDKKLQDFYHEIIECMLMSQRHLAKYKNTETTKEWADQIKSAETRLIPNTEIDTPKGRVLVETGSKNLANLINSDDFTKEVAEALRQWSDDYDQRMMALWETLNEVALRNGLPPDQLIPLPQTKDSSDTPPTFASKAMTNTSTGGIDFTSLGFVIKEGVALDLDWPTEISGETSLRDLTPVIVGFVPVTSIPGLAVFKAE